MEKQITFTQIKGFFTKDLETFGKMDPFLIFKIGKSQGKTETADDAGKQPVWKSQIVLHYFDQPTILVCAYEEDMTSNEVIGQGKIDVKALKSNGQLEIKITSEGEDAGKVTCKYALKTLPPTPLLTIKNIKCDFFKEAKFMLKIKPYFIVNCGTQNMATKPLEEEQSKVLKWDETLRVKVKDGEKLTFNVLDKEDNSKIFGYEANVKQFKTASGSKKFSVIDKLFEPLGVLQFDYETSHLVNKEQSTKNSEKAKKQANELTVITIDQIKGKLLESGEDIYFKINLGSNMFKTEYIQNAKKDFVMDLKRPFYAQHKQNKIIFAAFDKDLINDDVLGAGSLPLDGIASGERSVSLKFEKGTDEEKHIGDIIVKFTVKKVISKTLSITDIKVKLVESGDILGGSEPYVIGRIGGWSNRTQTASGQEVLFKKGLELKFSDEKEVVLQIWEEDITEHDKLFEEKVLVENLKAKGQMTIPLKSEDGKKKEGSITFKYETKNVVPEKKQQPKKQTEKKKEEKLKQEIKKQVKKQKQNKKQEQYKQSVKNFETDRQKEQYNDTSLYRSKNTLKLPSIVDPKNFGDRIFDKQSSATLQKSIHVYSMPKADRFGSGAKYAGQPSYYIDTCFKPNSTRGVGFGFGNKRQFPQWMEKNMKQNPAPGAYTDQHSSTGPDFRPKGPTFGLSYKYYEKVTIPKEKMPAISTERLKPRRDFK